MKFALATLYVKDMEKSLAFYNELLGIPVLRRQIMGPGQELVFMGVEGEPNLELIPANGEMNYTGFSIGFEVDNMETVKAKLAAKGYGVKREMSPGGDATLCFLDGPNGEEVELIEYK